MLTQLMRASAWAGVSSSRGVIHSITMRITRFRALFVILLMTVPSCSKPSKVAYIFFQNIPRTVIPDEMFLYQMILSTSWPSVNPRVHILAK